MSDLLQYLTVIILGLFTGSLLTEAILLVPYWRTMDPGKFLAQHHTMRDRLYNYFAPLTIAATTIPLVTAIYLQVSGGVAATAWTTVAVMMVAILAIYFAYFKSANKSFETGSVGIEGLPGELQRWQRWHWLRTIIAGVAFLAAIVAVGTMDPRRKQNPLPGCQPPAVCNTR